MDATGALLLQNYGPNTTPGWSYSSNGHHTFVNPNFGTLEIGQVPGASYDQWLFHENLGGGSLVVAYRRIEFRLHVVMLKANRFNLIGEDDYELPGGFSDATDVSSDGKPNKMKTGSRELDEETALKASNLWQVPGRLYVGNRAFFAVFGEHEGTSVFAFELSDEQLAAVRANPKLALMPLPKAINITRDGLSGLGLGRFSVAMGVFG